MSITVVPLPTVDKSPNVGGVDDQEEPPVADPETRNVTVTVEVTLTRDDPWSEDPAPAEVERQACDALVGTLVEADLAELQTVARYVVTAAEVVDR
jgi:hypothetical protein